MKGIVDELAQVLSVEEGRGRIVRALLQSPEIARRAKPLQFVLVKVRPGNDPFLRRPFCLSLVDPSSGLIRITWDVVGQGTAIMANWIAGQEVLVLGPLGNGLDLAALALSKAGAARRRMFIIAGGTGLAPMYPLAVAAKTSGYDVTLFYGAKSAEFLFDSSEFLKIGCAVTVATDDGSEGAQGFVTDIAAPALRSVKIGDVAVTCGPVPMMRETKRFCVEAGVDLYIVLEQRMACGTGLCRGCAVKAATKTGEPESYLHACLEGPVFRADQVDLEPGGEA
jgi:dihydroorotate dehydrogenase electron transfer subunit